MSAFGRKQTFMMKTCLGIELTKQVQLFENVFPTGFPRSSKSKVIFRPIFGKRVAIQKIFFAL
jgi:hypothetical protein